MLPLAILFIGGVVLTVGDIIMKRWTQTNEPFVYAGGMVVYLIGLTFLAFSFKYKGIAVASVLFIVFNVATLAIVGWLFFNEPLSAHKLIGISLALIAVVVLEMG